MDETAVWSDMVGNVTANTTGAKDVPLKPIRNEKIRVSVCLTTKADDTKLKLFIIFKGARGKTAALKEEFKKCCIVGSSPNAWMNEELILQFLRKVLGIFSFKKRLLAWDTFEAHMAKPVKKLLKQVKTDDALIPDGYTKYIKTPNIKNSFKKSLIHLKAVRWIWKVMVV